MAYVTEEIINKARIALKALNKEYGIKATLSGKGGSQLCLTVSEGSIDFIQSFADTITTKRSLRDIEAVISYAKETGNININHYYLDSSFEGKALEYMEKAKAIMMADHYDHSDIQSDYFNCAYYVSMRLGRWNKPYKLQK